MLKFLAVVYHISRLPSLSFWHMIWQKRSNDVRVSLLLRTLRLIPGKSKNFPIKPYKVKKCPVKSNKIENGHRSTEKFENGHRSTQKAKIGHRSTEKVENGHHLTVSVESWIEHLSPGADLGGWGGGGCCGRPSLRDSTPCRPKGSPLWYFQQIQFRPTNPKNFLKAPLAPIYTKFKGGARAKKNAIFWSKFSKKYLKMPFLDWFFKILPAAHKIWPK